MILRFFSHDFWKRLILLYLVGWAEDEPTSPSKALLVSPMVLNS